MIRVLGFAEKPQHMVDLAGLVKELNAEAYVVATGPEAEVRSKAFKVFSKVYYMGERVQPDQAVEILTKLYDQVSPAIVVGPATKTGNEVLARLAARKDLPMLTEVTSIAVEESRVKATRQVMGGRSTASYTVETPVALTITLRKWVYEGETGATIESVELPSTVYKVVEVEEKKREAVNIEEAEIVVGVGRGFKKKEDLRLAEELANLLGGVVGCTRPIAADYGWLSEDRWIGISGKKIKPKLYIAIGISGAPQHMAAAMDSKIIVAVNKDKNAPIFQYADYGVVADLYQFLPVLIEKLRKKLGKA